MMKYLYSFMFLLGFMSLANANVTVVGEGRVTATPDMATVCLAVSTENGQAKVAIEKNATLMKAVLNKLKNDFKIEDKNLATSGFSLSPRYEHQDNRQKFIGYT